MVLTRPVTKTVISTTEFGQPVYDWIVAQTPTPWTNVTLQNGWTHFATGPLQYRKIGDIVYLRGRADNAGGVAWQTIFTLPAGFRPTGDVFFATAIVQGTTWGTGTLQLNSAGIMIQMQNNVTVAPSAAFSTI